VEDEIKQDEGGFVQRLRESPRTVSALIIILIVAAAIYAFSGNNQPDEELVGEENNSVVAIEEQDEEVEEEAQSSGDTGQPASGVTTATPQPTPQESLPESSRTDTSYVEVAAAGEGVTHLARKATARWLEENQVDYEVTAEHRIYIEDYIKNQAGREPLNLGQEKAISFDLIAEAVGSARSLNEGQLKNLSQYTYALS
jgi:hypothetical protein